MKNIKFLFASAALVFVFSSVGSAQDAGLTSLDGEKVSVQSQKDKVVVLAIGPVWLPITKNQALVVNKLAKKYAGRDVVIYFVATDSINAKSKNFASNEEIRAFAERNKMIVPILRDSDGLITSKKFKVDEYPGFVVLDKQGTAVGKPVGGLTPKAEDDLANQISKEIDEIL